jgi:hypothetical protein
MSKQAQERLNAVSAKPDLEAWSPVSLYCIIYSLGTAVHTGNRVGIPTSPKVTLQICPFPKELKWNF